MTYEWIWLLLALAAGGVLLVGAVLADRRSLRRQSGADAPAPARGNPEVDRHVPRYLTQDEVDALTHPAVGRPRDLPHRGEGFAFGHAHPDFASNPDGASWDHPHILVVDGEVTSMRELLAPLGAATNEAPLVVVADGFHPEVIATLAANRRALDLPVVAAVAGRRDRTRLAELTGATQLSPVDLQAGYVPPEAIGVAGRWASTLKKTWVEPQGRTST